MLGATQLDELNEVALWVALNQINGLGNAGLYQLLTKFGSPENIFSAGISQLKSVVSDEIATTIHQGIRQENIQATLEWLDKEHAHIITLGDRHYPEQLLQISNPPVILYALGDLQLLSHPAIAIVGSRNATPQGEKNAESFSKDLCDQGFCIISGMALGIDGAAHRGALKSNGATIAVVGTGLDIVYPAKHRELAHQIASNGLILSEFPLGTPSKAQNFPRRNRIISGLSLGCLVIEANIDSGSMITARLAAEQGREVFAVPGSIHSPVSKGCHQLIKQGAKLVESSADIIEELKNVIPTHSPIGPMAHKGQNTPESNSILALMGFDPTSFESLLSASGLTPETLSSMLMLLELEGKVAALAGGKYQRLV
jgi:DNA processing protein